MGEIAEQLIEEEMFGRNIEYYPSRRFYKRTPAEKKISSVRKEIAMLIQNEKISVREARRQINHKYGKGWRERGLISNDANQWTNEDLKDFI